MLTKKKVQARKLQKGMWLISKEGYIQAVETLIDGRIAVRVGVSSALVPWSQGFFFERSQELWVEYNDVGGINDL